MSTNNDIRDLLNIRDKNILFYENAVTTVTYHQRKIKKVNAVLTYIPKYCERCGVINTHFTVVKNGTKTSMRTTVIEPGCHLSIAIKRLTLLYLSAISSIKTISKRACMHLPEVLCFDEVRLTSNVLGGLNFIYLDENKVEILDILLDRRQTTLKSHFLHYPKEVRDKVKYIVIDMNASYKTVIKTPFPNTAIFHIVQPFQRSLSSTRVTVSKQLSRKKDVLVLKRYWKKINKYSDKLDWPLDEK
ncbi:transposase [Dellaglioa algida]|uniref:ISL3 family transposase n=1 Tax=Dellaglioa algida TaxID=105612 RepID=A0A5C6MAQ0_9LACO|nr:transposase [Dellaglioa algida]MDK1717053.1 transposase [Dellaglioa algida]MDK1719877.1 transposase [Dellaglioa algida]MDK1721995.1 transposase [Dellaglioa algida]MDK1723220.1 transposase [Dellaglioa algida]MDK1739829.1 transposase [Dellaglioa algida]